MVDHREHTSSDWLRFVLALADFAYLAGREAARDGLPRIMLTNPDEPCDPIHIIAWEQGWDDERGNGEARILLPV